MGSADGSKRTTKKGPSNGRVTKSPNARVGRYVTAEERGRYTPPCRARCARVRVGYGPAIVGIFILGLLTIILNYINLLPGSVSSWYSLAGIVIIFVGFAAMLRYH